MPPGAGVQTAPIPVLPLALVAAAAVLHAAWNLLAKRAADEGLPFVWLLSATSAVLWAPLGIGAVLLDPDGLGVAAALLAAGSGVLHVGYFLALQRGYREGDLSVVYPLARGTGPVLATVGAVAVLGERPGPVRLAGTALVAAGVLLVAGSGLRRPTRGARLDRGVVWGLVTGAAIAAYTVWDGNAVGNVGAAPLAYSWATTTAETALLGPAALRRRAAVAATWQRYRREVLAVGVLSPLAYVLVLVALTLAPVSYVAPAREVSVVLGALLGARLLGEADAGRRVLGAALIALGIVALTAG